MNAPAGALSSAATCTICPSTWMRPSDRLHFLRGAHLAAGYRRLGDVGRPLPEAGRRLLHCRVSPRAYIFDEGASELRIAYPYFDAGVMAFR